MSIYLHALTNNLSLTLDTDESYTLQTIYSENEIKVEIIGNTVFGVRHGIETLLQLIVPYEEKSECLATLSFIQITDKPLYRHRGLLLDTARNYLSVKIIKKNIDGMAASKMNVLHWHITDSQSFPLVSPSLPNMTIYGAYNEKQIYSPQDVKDLVEYAKLRGVKILMEIDGPSHAGFGWQWGEEAGLGNLAVCINQQPWRSFCIQPPCGQLNPVNPNVYRMLNYLYKDISNVVPNADIFHMGGDEATFTLCKPIFEPNVVQWRSKQAPGSLGVDGDSEYIIQTWVTESEQNLITNLLKLGYKLILSTKDRWYLDHGFWGSTTYYNWRRIYENQMSNHPSILGGEVTAAAAERLWTNPNNKAGSAEARYYAHRTRLISRGIKAESEIPRWCIQNEGECSAYLL
ncbi:hypothetical protein NQ314_016511 [Rhamnusium bicolor]|uniref:beta-N-acetylhexosaminidase n=1 Tax=Rhamnusium bicolor TaxID=1586634 RepID=A0AAV8WVR1_9CUCU|nr:hypothetical protein NQ314_016511 [Rhamnusium bicolor]